MENLSSSLPCRLSNIPDLIRELFDNPGSFQVGKPSSVEALHQLWTRHIFKGERMKTRAMVVFLASQKASMTLTFLNCV